MAQLNERLRKLPRVDEVLAHPLLAQGAGARPHILARAAARAALESAREALLAGESEIDVSLERIAAQTAALLAQRQKPSLRRAINGAGIILHTGLGRAPFSAAAQAALAEATAGFSTVQASRETGARTPREIHVEWLLQEITGAEAALVVNNNAAATVLALNSLAAGKEVVVSRGEMVEIGGSFRIPEILRLSGCRLVEVGCTNRTHLRDYEGAIGEETALLLAIHQSNYRIVGFASQPPLEDLAVLAHAKGLICAHDLGSGALVDLQQYGLPHEPGVAESLRAGADVVFFSGDKLVGGPQCGLILGAADLLAKMRKNPFYRTFRVDKMALAVLEATLRLFLEPETLPQTHAVMAMLTAPAKAVKRRASRLCAQLKKACRDKADIEIQEGTSEVGGGSLAGRPLPTWNIRIKAPGLAAEEVARRLRAGEPPIFSRIQEEAVWLDMRTVLSGEEAWLRDGVVQALTKDIPEGGA